MILAKPRPSGQDKQSVAFHDMKNEHYLLRQTQAVRNACAHSTNIVNGFSLREPSSIRTPKEVAIALGEIGINKRAQRSKMANPRIQQITMVAYAYHGLVTGIHSREMCLELVDSLKKRINLHADWYEGVDSVHSSFDFLNTVFVNWI